MSRFADDISKSGPSRLVAFALPKFSFPGLARVFRTWLSPIERNSAEGIKAAAARWGAAVTPALIAALYGFLNWRQVFALFGAVAGEGVVWYTGQFWQLYYLQNVAKVDLVTSNIVLLIALAAGTPFFIVFGRLSDRIGRKKIMLLGNLLAAVTYVPIFMGISYAASIGSIPLMAFLGWILVVYVTMVYAPIAAYLVELFPTRIRYTSLSFPYHIGNGWFGGSVPFIALGLIIWFGGVQYGAGGAILSISNPYVALIYPIAVALMTSIIMAFFVKETRGTKIWSEVQ